MRATDGAEDVNRAIEAGVQEEEEEVLRAGLTDLPGGT